MDIKGQVRTDTKIYTNILDKASGTDVRAGKIVHIIGIKRYGVNSYYVLDGNACIESKNVVIVRDNGFYYDNYKSKVLQKNNIGMVTKKGLSYALDDLGGDYTDTYFDLQRFAAYDTGSFITVKDNPREFKPSRSDNFSVGGGFGGGLISTTNPTYASDNLANTQVASLAGISSNSVGGQLLNGVGVGSLFDGSFLSIVATNLLNMVAGLFGNKLKFVIGFSFAAGLAGSTFGSTWSNASRNFNSNATGNWTGAVGDTISRPDVTITYYGTGGSVIRSQYEQRQLPNSPMNTKFQNYFSYYVPLEGDLVSSRQLSTIANSRYGFFSDYHTGSANPTRPSIETQFYKSISDATYEEVKSGLDAVRVEFNLDIDRETTFKKFNRFRVPTPNNELTNTRGHIFFTRPDMNLAMDKSTSAGSGIRTRVTSSAHSAPFMYNMLKSHSVLSSYMMGDSAGGGDNMVPILTHCCTGIDISDEILETVEAHESFTGWKVIYGKSNVKSRTAGTMNIAFTDDNMLSIYKILKIWTEYISAVYRGETTPKDMYADYHILDYAISIYYFLCKENDEDILFWSKYTGCFPTAAPASNFSDTIDKHIERPSYSVPFSFAKKDDYNPIDIYEFNQLTNGTSYDYLPTYNEKTHHVQKSFMGAPFVDTLDGTHLFKLRFRAPSN